MEYWKSTKRRLYDERVDRRLQTLFTVAEDRWPFPHWTMQIGRTGAYRTADMQKEMVDAGASKTMSSKHCIGQAIDITIYKAGTEQAIWSQYAYSVVHGFLECIAKECGVALRWGADWDQDGDLVEKDNWEVDFVHHELG